MFLNQTDTVNAESTSNPHDHRPNLRKSIVWTGMTDFTRTSNYSHQSYMNYDQLKLNMTCNINFLRWGFTTVAGPKCRWGWKLPEISWIEFSILRREIQQPLTWWREIQCERSISSKHMWSIHFFTYQLSNMKWRVRAMCSGSIRWMTHMPC